jgi:hypothetical protein
VISIGRRRWTGFACLLLAVVIAAIAVADHRNKQSRADHAQLEAWYCVHEGTRCGGPSAEGIERHWNERQIAYEAAVAILAGCGLAYLVLPGRQRRSK